MTERAVPNFDPKPKHRRVNRKVFHWRKLRFDKTNVALSRTRVPVAKFDSENRGFGPFDCELCLRTRDNRQTDG